MDLSEKVQSVAIIATFSPSSPHFLEMGEAGNRWKAHLLQACFCQGGFIPFFQEGMVRKRDPEQGGL